MKDDSPPPIQSLPNVTPEANPYVRMFNPENMNYAKPFQLGAKPTRSHEAIARYHRTHHAIRQTSNDRPSSRSPQSHTIRASRHGARMD